MAPLLFIMVMDGLPEYIRDGSLMGFLYTDNLVLCGELLNEVMDKVWEMEKCSGKKGSEGEC